MSIKEQFDIIRLSSSSQISGIVIHPMKKGEIFVSGGHGELFTLSIDPFKIVNSIKIFNQVSMCLAPFNDGILVGGSNGELVYLNLNN